MNIKKIQELVAIMKENDISEIEIEEDGSRVKLVKKPGDTVSTSVVLPPVHHEVARTAKPQAPPAQPQESQIPPNVKEVKAPMVGTFYRAPAPDAKPYVQVGDIVHKGDVLCVVEAMKLMNEVKSDFDGKIISILLENAEPVEFGQTMFLIELV